MGEVKPLRPDTSRPFFLLRPAAKARADEGKCTSCGAVINESDFRDRKSRREYRLSGFCQVCQDSIFEVRT